MTILEKEKAYVWHHYTQMKTAEPPLPLVRGEGALLFDESGNRYIDAFSRQGKCDAAADSACAAGDQSSFSLQSCIHRRYLSRKALRLRFKV